LWKQSNEPRASKEEELGPRKLKQQFWTLRREMQKRGLKAGEQLPVYEPHSPTLAQDQEDEKMVYAMILADTQRSLETMLSYCERFPVTTPRLKVISGALATSIYDGHVREASERKALLLGLNLDASGSAATLAKQLQVTLRSQRIIYRLMDDVCEAVSLRLPTHEKIDVVGTADVAQIFPVKGRKRSERLRAAGCRVKSGSIIKKNRARVLRGGLVVFDGVLSSLRHEKEEKETIAKGEECGVLFEGWNLCEPGDVMESFVTQRVLQRIDDSAARGFLDPTLPKWTHKTDDRLR